MLRKPILARCDNRRSYARRHLSSGDPEEWLADTYLKHYKLLGLTFDFFVNWNARSIPNQLWIKRIVRDAFTPWPITQWRGIPGEIYRCDGEEQVQHLCRFADTHNFTCHYFLFKESLDSQHPPAPIVEVRFNDNGTVVRVLNVKLSDLKDRIQQLRGGPFRSSEPFNYSTTSLECFLYNQTTAPWPGDADMVLVDNNFTPIAIIEFKKHTRRSRSISFADQKLSNYYKGNDRYKYDSFAYLRDHFTNDPSTLPIVVLYYSIETDYDYVMLELVEGTAGNLTAPAPVRFPLPNINNAQSCRNLVESLMQMINYEA